MIRRTNTHLFNKWGKQMMQFTSSFYYAAPVSWTLDVPLCCQLGMEVYVHIPASLSSALPDANAFCLSL